MRKRWRLQAAVMAGSKDHATRQQFEKGSGIAKPSDFGRRSLECLAISGVRPAGAGEERLMMTHQRPRIDWDEAFRLHEEEEWSFAEIAREFGYSPKTVRTALLKRGAHRRRPARLGRVARKLRRVWRYTREKCEKPRHSAYPLYGAKGVRVSSEWAEFEPFYAWARASGYRLGLRLALLDEHGPYGPRNCRWVTAAERVHARQRQHPRSATRKKPKPINWSEATRLYLEEGLSMPVVARSIGSSYTGVIAGFKRLGIKRPKKSAPTSTLEGVRLYSAWWSIHARCEDPKNPAYPYNGARGAKVAREWSEVEPFLRWAIATGSKPGLWLTRIDPSRNYSPRNCTWSTRDEVLRKRRPPKRGPGPRRLITALGETKGLLEWARDPRCHVIASTISHRLGLGWDRQTAITAPPANPGARGILFRKLRAYGQVKGLTGWARDKRCRVTITGLGDRLRRGWTVEDALTTPPFKQPARQLARK